MNIRKSLATAAALAMLAACSPADDGGAATEESPAPVEQTAEESSLDAGEVEQALLSTFGVDNFRELESTHWAYYIADVDTPSGAVITLTMQTDSDDPIIEGASQAAFSLIGGQFEDVTHLELVDGIGDHIEETRRQDVPLLN